MKEMFSTIIRDEEGQGMVEYGLIIAGIAVVIIGAMALLGPGISDQFTAIKAKLTPAP